MARLFWTNFFRLLLLTAAVAQWTCIAWLARDLGVELSWWTHAAAVSCLAVLNHQLPRPAVTGAAWSRSLRRVYTGVAFASLFGFVFLALNGAFWSVAWAAWEVGGFGANAASGQWLLGASRTVGTAGLVTVGAAIAYGYSIGQRRTVIEEVAVGMRGMTNGSLRHKPMTIVQISDIHLGQFMDERSIVDYVDRVNALEADLVCITGDITDGLHHAEQTFPALGRLEARLGVIAILGNHDHYTGADAVEQALGDYTDFVVLRDRRIVIEDGDFRLHVIGVDDLGHDWARGLEQHPALDGLAAEVPVGEAMLLLSHRPDPARQAVRLGIDLMLAGHTHGGQLALPWPGRGRPSLAHFITRYPRGTYRLGDTVLHVNLGLGVTGQPVRLHTPREITRITVQPKGVPECETVH